MNYYKPPKPEDYPLDMNAGFEYINCRSQSDFKWHLNKVCFYLMNKNKLKEAEGERGCNYEQDFCDDAEVEVLSHLGLLRTLMRTPYAHLRLPLEWNVFATFFNNKLYVINRRDHSGMNLNSSHYFKFEQYCFSDDPQVEPDASGPIDDEHKIRCIFRSQLKNFKLVYSSQVNGISSNQQLENLKDVEALQQCRFVQTVLTKKNANRGILSWKNFSDWIKAHLTAADVMYVGCNTPDGFVEEPAKRLLVKHLPRNQQWAPKVCYQFLYNFIEKVIRIMHEVNSPYTCYEFHYDNSTDCITYRIHEGKTNFSFLEEDYIAHMMK